VEIALDLSGSLDGTRCGSKFEATAVGEFNYLAVGGRVGWHARRPGSHVRVDTAALTGEAATLSVWVSPLETLAAAVPMQGFIKEDPFAQAYSLVADAVPNGDPQSSTFALTYFTRWRPQLTARLSRGWPDHDHGHPPAAAAEHLILRQGHWYQLAVSFSLAAGHMDLYVNGIMVAQCAHLERAERPAAQICMGNTAFVVAGLRVSASESSPEDVLGSFNAEAKGIDATVQEELRSDYEVGVKQAFDWKPSASWTLAYATNFTHPDDLEGWTQQGCLDDPYRLKERSTSPEGLLLQTPDTIDTESRVYLWSPQVFDGDVAVSFDFRPDSPTGFAMLITQASGMQREDFITDHPRRTTGAMRTIIGDRVRNYYWGFYRRTSSSARDGISTHTLMKNPWLHHLGMASAAPLATGQWHRAAFVQTGSRIRCAIDGHLMLDCEDDPTIGAGPVLNTGRIGFRLMFQTRIWLTHLRVHTSSGSSIVQPMVPHGLYG
jgi:hypothetical protein